MREVLSNREEMHPRERWVALLAAVVCSAVTVVVWRSVGAYQPMWPLPGLYLAELMFVTGGAAWVLCMGHAWSGVLTWVAAGIVTAFSILGALSVGAAYAPVALLLVAVGLSADVRRGRPVWCHVAAFLAAAVAQGALMLFAIRVLYPSAFF